MVIPSELGRYTTANEKSVRRTRRVVLLAGVPAFGKARARATIFSTEAAKRVPSPDCCWSK